MIGMAISNGDELIISGSDLLIELLLGNLEMNPESMFPGEPNRTIKV